MIKYFQYICAVVSVLTLLSFSVSAQDNERTGTLLGRNSNISGFGGPILEFSAIDGEFAYTMGGGGAVLINRKFFFGGYGMSLQNSSGLFEDEPHFQDNYKLRFRHGGFWTGYKFNTNSVVHWGISSRLGWGEVAARETGIGKVADANVFVVSPQVEAELNVTRWARINLGAGYRFVTENSDFNNAEGNLIFDTSELSGAFVQLTFKFGWF